MTKNEARRRAIAAGATEDEIEAEVAIQRRQPASIRRSMIYALCLHAWNNPRHEWVRLAAALTAQSERRSHA